jgi:transmembrane sensor
MDVAFDWLSELNSGASLSMERRRALSAWLEAQPAHAEAFAEAQRLWADLDWSEALNAAVLPAEPSARPLGRRRAPTEGRPGRWRRWRAPAAVAAALIGAVMIGPGLQRQIAAALWVRTVETATGPAEIRHIVLSDGSQVTLGGRSTLRVRMEDDKRQVELVEGDAFFDVATAPQRPFTVAAGDLNVTVIGTAFEVNRGNRSAHVAVSRGRVRATAAESVAILTPGQAATVRPDGSLAVEPFDPASAGRWRDQRAAFRDAPLGQVVESLNRYHPAGVILEDPSLADLPVTVAFRFDQMEIALTALAQSKGLSVRRDAAGRIVIGRRTGA